MSQIPLVDTAVHHDPRDLRDRFAFGFTKLLRFCADTFFAKRYGHRAIVLETVAAVPGMVGATVNHLKCLRRMCGDNGWIRTLMEETLRDVVLVVRADEAHHRDVNHGFANELAGVAAPAAHAPYPEHEPQIRLVA